MSIEQSYVLHRSDVIEALKSLPDKSIDLLITDPAYESLEKHRKKGTTTRLKHSKSSSNDWFPIFPNTRFEEFFREAYRVLKNNTHMYIFCDQETMFVIKPIAEKMGFTFWKPLIWDKKRIGMGYHYRSRYECILFFEKGKRKLKNLGIPDILEFPRVSGGYPTEKPYQVAEVLILQSSNEGDLVLDTFCGSGFTGYAANKNKRKFIGIDILPEAIEKTKIRLETLQLVGMINLV